MADTSNSISAEFLTGLSLQLGLGDGFRDGQAEAITAAARGDVSIVLPTGYGKTAVVKSLPNLPGHHRSPLVLVICPLNAICQQHLGTLPNAKWLQKAEEVDVNTHYLIGHPEVMLNEKVKVSLKAVADRVTFIVIDESHCVLQWGVATFRPMYRRIGELRAILPEARVISMTATVTDKDEEHIQKILRMRKPQSVRKTPDRSNLLLRTVKRLPTCGAGQTVRRSLFHVIDPLLKALQQPETFPRTIIYSNINNLGLIHARAIADFGIAEHSSDGCGSIAQYHQPQSDNLKRLLVDDLLNEAGQVRLLLATEAFSMGADPRNIRRVIHIGPPTKFEIYVQEIGRCARDGQPGEAILFWNKSDFSTRNAKGEKIVDESMANYASAPCLRAFLCRHFGFAAPEGVCHCGACETPAAPKPAATAGSKLTGEDFQRAYAKISDFCSEQNEASGFVFASSVTGLDDRFACMVSANPTKYLNAPAELERDFNVDPALIGEVLNILESLEF